MAGYNKRMPQQLNRIVMDGTLNSVRAIDLSILEKGRDADPMEWRIRKIDALRERMPCHNPLCNDGGFLLGDLIRELVRAGQTEYIGANYCVGQEGDPEKPETLVSCGTRFEVTAAIQYVPRG